MKDKVDRVLSRIFVSFLILGAVAAGASAQETSSVTVFDPGAYQTLSGKIRWKKSLGVVPASRGSSNKHDSPCSIFWIAAMDPEQRFKVIGSFNALQPGIDEPDYYVCKYSLRLPVNRRMMIRAGMGSDCLFALPGNVISNYYYNNDWIGDYSEERRKGWGTYRAITRSFAPGNPYVTLSKGKGTYLKFELNWALRTDQLDPPRIVP